MSAEESAERIYALLSDALSQNAEQRQRAEQALRDAEELPDFFASLVMITTATDDSAEPRVRWLAAVCGKNAVSRSWRRRTLRNQVTEDERSYVMQMLTSAMGEKHSTIATQVSVWISLIARIDYPKHWPNLIADLCTAIQSTDASVMLHSLITLDMVIKQLASRRLLADRTSLYRITPDLFALLFQLFCSHLQILVQNQGPAEVERRAFDVVVRCLKSFRRILTYGCESICKIPSVSPMFAKLLEFPDVFLRGAKGGTESQLKLSLLAAKLVRSTHERHPVDCQPYLPALLGLYYNDVIAFDSQVSSGRVCYQAAYFLRNALQCPAYEISGRTIEEFKENTGKGVGPPEGVSAAGCRFIVLSFFDENRTNTLIEAMISKIFVLNEAELEVWTHDPEALIREEEAAEWGTENLRHECEELFKIILIREKRRVVPLILQLTESVSTDKPLLLDACYRAVGRAVDDVQGAFDFDSWLNGRLGAILRADCSANMGERIIQARAAWLVGQFVGQYSRENHQVVYPLLIRLMEFMERDRFLALTAAKSVQNMVEDFEFHADDLAPHIAKCLTACLRLISFSEAFETRRAILTMITSITHRCPANIIVPVMDLVVGCLPTLWEEGRVRPNVAAEHLTGGSGENEGTDPASAQEGAAGGQNILRSAIVLLLSLLVRKFGPAALQSVMLRKLLFPVIDFAVDLTPGKGGTFMMEDGCDLWANVVKASTEYSEELAMLFRHTTKILDVDYGNLREVCDVTEQYALVGKETFMQQYGQDLLETFGRTMDSVKDRGCLATVDILDTLLQLFPQEGVQFGARILQSCFRRLLSGAESHVLMAAFAALLARALLVNIADTERVVLEGNEQGMLELIDAILENLDLMHKLPRRKMAMLSVAGLAGRYMGNGKVQERVPGILNGFVQVLSQERAIRERKGNPEWSRNFENAISRFGEDQDVGRRKDGQELPGELRMKALVEGDVVTRMGLAETCTGLLGEIKMKDVRAYEAILGATDQTVLRQLEELVRS